MDITEIKKALYKEKPAAHKIFTGNIAYQYYAELADGTKVYFEVPVSDMGELPFEATEQAQLLIRYIKL